MGFIPYLLQRLGYQKTTNAFHLIVSEERLDELKTVPHLRPQSEHAAAL